MAILDSTYDESEEVIHHQVLEVDQDGHLPKQPDEFDFTTKSCLEVVANDDLTVSKHE